MVSSLKLTHAKFAAALELHLVYIPVSLRHSFFPTLSSAPHMQEKKKKRRSRRRGRSFEARKMASAKNWLEKSLLLGGKLVGAATKKKTRRRRRIR